MKTYGYARVSSADQNATRQLDALEKAGVARANIFVDHKSGRDFDLSPADEPAAALNRGRLRTIAPTRRLSASARGLSPSFFRRRGGALRTTRPTMAVLE